MEKTEELLTTLVNEIRDLKRAIIITMMKDLSQKESTLLLRRLGYTPKQIAELLGTTANTIRVTLARIKEKNKNDK